MKDPYETLGVTRSATDKEVKDAFKKLARKFHPDLHPGDKAAEEKFKDISAANDLLKDKEKRRRFDAGEIDASAAEKSQERFYATSPMGLPTPRMQRRTGSPAKKLWRNSWRARLGAGHNVHRAQSGRVDRM
jgi:curved DNA-binding protein CbpA